MFLLTFDDDVATESAVVHVQVAVLELGLDVGDGVLVDKEEAEAVGKQGHVVGLGHRDQPVPRVLAIPA